MSCSAGFSRGYGSKGSDRLKPRLQRTKRLRIIQIGNAIRIGIIGLLADPFRRCLLFDRIPKRIGKLTTSKLDTNEQIKVVAGAALQHFITPLLRRRSIWLEVHFVSRGGKEAASTQSIDRDKSSVIRGKVAPRPEEHRSALGASAEDVLDFFEVRAVPREITRLLLMLQSEHRKRTSRLTDVHAMIVQTHGAAHDAAEAHVALRSDEAVHFHRDETAEREDAALAELMDVATGLAVGRPQAGVAFAI